MSAQHQNAPNPVASSTSSPRRPAQSQQQQPVALSTCSHVNVCRPWITWKKGSISEYVSKPRVFFDHFHHEIVLFTGSPPNKMWLSDRQSQTWTDYPVLLPPHNDIIGAQFSPDRSHVALRVSDKEVKVVYAATGEVVTARSCRGTSSRMISVHWVYDPAAVSVHANNQAMRRASLPVHSPSGASGMQAQQSQPLFLLFVTNAGVELYELTTEKGHDLLSSTSKDRDRDRAASMAVGSASAPGAVKAKLKHVKTATYNIVYHWMLWEENLLLLVDNKNVFQAYKLSSKQISKICKFELDCAGTALHPPPVVPFHREQISLHRLYGRFVIAFVNEAKGQLHLLSLANGGGAGIGGAGLQGGGQQSMPSGNLEMEQTHVFDLYAPGRYDVSNIDNVLVVHSALAKVSMVFDVRSESQAALTEPLPIGPSVATSPNQSGGAIASGSSSGAVVDYFPQSTLISLAYGSTTATDASNSAVSPSSSTPSHSATASSTISSDPVAAPPSTLYPRVSSLSPHSAPGVPSLAPASFHPYHRWTFLNPRFVWESTGEQQQGNLWTLRLNLQQMAYSWPHNKRARLIDFLLKRTTIDAKHLILQILLHIVVTEPTSLALLSRLFSLLNRINYDHRMNPLPNSFGAAGQSQGGGSSSSSSMGGVGLASLPLKPMYSNPPSAANTAPNSTFTTPAHAHARGTVGVGSMRPPLNVGSSPSASGDSSRLASPAMMEHSRKRSSISSSPTGATLMQSSPSSVGALPGAYADLLDESHSVLSCDMVDLTALPSFSKDMSLEHNAMGYMIISPLDLFLYVFAPARLVIPPRLLLPVVVEFVRSAHRHFLKIDDVLNDLLVSLMIQIGADEEQQAKQQHGPVSVVTGSGGASYELHQYLQYHIIHDSLPLANLLLNHSNTYPAAYQIGLDMVSRLGRVSRTIQILLARGQVLAALKIIPSYTHPVLETAGSFPRDFLKVALESGCNITFYTTYRFFEGRNAALKNGNGAFVAADACDEFVKEFQRKFRPSNTAAAAATSNSGSTTTTTGWTTACLLMGDEDDEDDDDDDIEYEGPKPPLFDPSIASTEDDDHASSPQREPSTLPPAIDVTASSSTTTVPTVNSSSISSPSSESRPSSSRVVSPAGSGEGVVGLMDGEEEEEEVEDAELSGLGASEGKAVGVAVGEDESGQNAASSSSAFSPEPSPIAADTNLTMDGSFGGSGSGSGNKTAPPEPNTERRGAAGDPQPDSAM